MSQKPAAALKRSDVHPGPLIDGRNGANGASGRFSRRLQQVLVSKGEREEAELEHRIRGFPA